MLLLHLFTAVLLLPQGGKPGPAAAPYKPYKLDNPVSEELKLTDLEGKEHALFAESKDAEGKDKAVLLVFWSYRDPVSRFYVAQLAALQAAHAGRLTLYLVDSNADEIAGSGDPLARIREVVQAEGITLPVLVDRDNRIADDFAAIANAQAFLMDANRNLRYMGGIDDDPRGDRRKRGIPLQALLEEAVDTVLKGERIEHNWTRAAGRPIKRPAKVPAADPAPGKDPVKDMEKKAGNPG